MNKKTKKILLIAYHYHPDLAVGAVRTVKLAKYLPHFGWEPLVLTVKTDYYGSLDDTPLGFSCRVYRTAKWPVPDEVYRMVKGYLKSFRRRRQGSGSPVPVAEGTDNFGKTGIPLWRRSLNALSRLPDDKMGWLYPGISTAVRLIRERDIDVIYSSGPPHTCHVIALLAKKFTGKFWVADFRDPWTTAVQAQEIETGFSRWVARYLEKKVMKHADLVLATTPDLHQDLARLYPQLEDGRIATLLNGFDEDDFRDRKKKTRRPEDKITFLYAGNLYKGRDPYAFLVALGELIEEGFFGPTPVAVDFYGKVAVDPVKMNDAISKYNLSDIVHFYQAVGRDAYVDLIMNADVLILVQAPNQAAMIPAKTFDYLATGNEILALLPPGAAADMLASFENVALADNFDTEGIKAGIKRLTQRIRMEEPGAPKYNDSIRRVTKRKLTETLCSLLERKL